MPQQQGGSLRWKSAKATVLLSTVRVGAGTGHYLTSARYSVLSGDWGEGV